MRGVLICLMLLLGIAAGHTNPFDIVLQQRAGTSLQTLRLYSDSTFAKPTRDRLPIGQIVSIIGESELEHEDDAQKQTFKWFRIRTLQGQEAWVFGDGLAVSVAPERLSPAVREFQHQQLHFGTGFEKAIVWAAVVDGHDNFHANTLLNPVYYESYLVLTNAQGRSVPIYYGGESTQGRSEVQQMQFQELTGDDAPELILLQNYYPLNETVAQRQLELYSFQAGSIRKIFEERLNLPATKDNPCPFKYVELDEGIIRVEYVEAKTCDNYTLPLATGTQEGQASPCLEYVTYTYSWDRRNKNYQVLYEENRSAPQVKVAQAGVVLQEGPTDSAKRIQALPPNETLDVIREQVTVSQSRRGTQRESYLYVRLADGRYGYLPTRFTNFVQTAHAEQLDHYFRQPNRTPSNEKWTYYGIRGVHQDSSAYNH